MLRQNKSDTDNNPKNKVKKKKSSILNRVTHLYLQEKKLKNIPNLFNPQDIQVLYLYGNSITKIENLKQLINLTNLYLQNNQINSIEDLTNLQKLKKLYLGKNEISVLEGLECIKSLEEIYIEKQRLSNNSPLCFDPRSIANIADSLKILNISHNKIPFLTYLSLLKNLEILDASYNNLEDKKDVCQTLRNWFYLKEAKFLGNPISKQHRYREDIIANTYQLKLLDNKEISDPSRNFIQRFEASKMINGSSQKVNIPELFPGLPSNYPKSLQQAASTSLIKDFKCKTLNDDNVVFEQAEPVYLSWNHLPKRDALKAPASQSMLRGHKMENQKNILVRKTTIKMRNLL